MLHLRMRFAAPVIFVFLGLVTGCTFSKEYDINIQDVNTEVSLFEEGLTVPLGSTNKIALSSLLNSSGQNLDDFLKTDAEGRLILTYEGSTSLNGRIAELDLDKISKIDGIKFNEDFTYHVGEISADKFTIPADTYEISVPFSGVESVDLTIDPLNTNLNALSFKAGLDKYKNVVSGNSDLQLSDKIGKVGYEKEVERNATLATLALAYGSGETFSIPKEVLPDKDVEKTSIPVKVQGITLNEDVTAISNIKTDPGAKMTVSLKLTDPFINGGTIVPDIDLDLSDIVLLSGGSKINLGSLELKPSNSWTASKTYDITGLATTAYSGTISIDESATVEGTIRINSPTTSSTTLSTGGNMKLELSITFTDLTITSADIAVKPISYNHTDVISIGNEEPFVLPEDVKDVKEVKMDQTKPLYLKITPSNLNRLKGKNIPYEIRMTFPDNVDVEGAVGGILTITGDLASSPLNSPIVIKSFYPEVDNGSASVNAVVNVEADFTAENLVLSSSDLPNSEDQDIAFSASIEGNPAVEDIVLTINDIEKDTERSENLEFDVNGAESLGSFVITPEGTPSLTITSSVPEIPGLDIVPANGGILITLPDLFVFDTSSLPVSATFSEENHTILVHDEIPTLINLPILKLKANPVKVGDDYKIQTSYSITGKILIPSADVNHSDLTKISGKEFGITVNFPEIKAKTIDLDDELSFNVDEKYDMGFDLDTDGLLKKIDVVNLNEVYLNLSSTFENLPEMGEEGFYSDLLLTLPEYITPSTIPVKGYVVDGKLEIAPVKIEKLSNIEIPEDSHIPGEITVTGSVSAEGKNIELSSLKSDITVHFNATIGDKDGNITFSKATGFFTYDIDQSTSVSLDNVPDMLKGDDVSPDLDDPQIALTINTNLGIKMKGEIEIIPVFGETPDETNKISLKDIVLPFSDNASAQVSKSYVICKSAATAPEGYEVLEADVSKLLKKIPDELRISIKASVDDKSASIIETDATYTLDIAYSITAPLAFGEDFHFDTTTDIDLSSLSSYTDIGEFGIKGKAVNDSPLNLSVEMVLLDGEEVVIPQSKSSSVLIKGDTTSDIEFYLSPTDKTRSISKGRLVISVTAVTGQALKESSSLQLTDLVAILPEGLTYTIIKTDDEKN